MRCSCSSSAWLVSPNPATATPKASPRLATSTALPLSWVLSVPSRADSVTIRPSSRAPACCNWPADAATRASMAWRWSLAAWLTATSSVASVPMMRLRSSSSVLSRARLSDSCWRIRPSTSAAARGASAAPASSSETSPIVLRACTSHCCCRSRAVHASVSQICCCCCSVWLPACCHSRCSAPAMASSVAVQAASRCWSLLAASACSAAWARVTLASSAADRCSKPAATPASVCCSPVTRAWLLCPCWASAVVQTWDTLSTLLPKRAARPSSWACTVSTMRAWKAALSRATPASVASTAGPMLAPARRALSVRLSFSDRSTDAASAA